MTALEVFYESYIEKEKKLKIERSDAEIIMQDLVELLQINNITIESCLKKMYDKLGDSISLYDNEKIVVNMRQYLQVEKSEFFRRMYNDLFDESGKIKIFFEKINVDLQQKYSILLKNIAISYIFENTMLESKNEIPNYLSVVKKCNLLIMFFKYFFGCALYKKDNDEKIEEIIYNVMRTVDHGSDILDSLI